MNITEFLLARISEDEAVAQTAAADNDSARWNVIEIVYEGIHVYARPSGLDAEGGRGETTAHIQRHDPARVLAECAAKRAIIALDICVACDVEDQPCGHMYDTLEALARVYADHPDFDPTCM